MIENAVNPYVDAVHLFAGGWMARTPEAIARSLSRQVGISSQYEPVLWLGREEAAAHLLRLTAAIHNASFQRARYAADGIGLPFRAEDQSGEISGEFFLWYFGCSITRIHVSASRTDKSVT